MFACAAAPRVDVCVPATNANAGCVLTDLADAMARAVVATRDQSALFFGVEHPDKRTVEQIREDLLNKTRGALEMT